MTLHALHSEGGGLRGSGSYGGYLVSGAFSGIKCLIYLCYRSSMLIVC